MSREVISVRKYKVGYEIREEVIDGHEFGGEDYTMKIAYTPDGSYIGSPKTAYRLCMKRGIKPEKASADHNVCSIGYCEKEKKWYGWSHRALYGFGIGSMMKTDSSGFKPSNVREMMKGLIDWYNNGYDEVLFIEKEYGIEVVCKTGSASTTSFEKYPKEWGRGEWTAETIEDAKEMAIDFADSVS